MSDLYNLGKMVEQISKDIKKVVNPVIQMNQNLLKGVIESVDRFNNLINLSELKDNVDRVKKGLIETEEDLKIFKAAIIELGYPPHEGMDIRTMRSIAQAYKEDRGSLFDAIDDIMCDYYDSEIIMELSNIWEENENIKARLPILRNVIMSHNQGMYSVSIPAILSQFEGILVDAFEIKGKVDGVILNKLLRCLLHDNQTAYLSFDNEIHKYYETNILVGFKHGEIMGSEISRHAILHGGDKYYGKQTNSLKLILLFDYIASKIENVENDKIIKAKKQIKSYRDFKRKKYKKKR